MSETKVDGIQVLDRGATADGYLTIGINPQNLTFSQIMVMIQGDYGYLPNLEDIGLLNERVEYLYKNKKITQRNYDQYNEVSSTLQSRIESETENKGGGKRKSKKRKSKRKQSRKSRKRSKRSKRR